MRAVGEISQALLEAAKALEQQAQGATLLEIADRANVSRTVARWQVPNLKRAGHLRVVGQRRVGYRNRPVLVYAPAVPVPCVPAHGGAQALVMCMQGWGR